MRKFKFTPPPSLKDKESSFLKYISVVLMTFGGINIALSFGGFFDIPTTAWYTTEVLGKADPTAMLITAGILSMILGWIELVTGIFGFVRREKRNKMDLCLILGGVTAAMIAAIAVWRMIADNPENGLSSLIELIPAALYLIAAYEWKTRKIKK